MTRMLPTAFFAPGQPSFAEFLGDVESGLVRRRLLNAADGAEALPFVPHGTTIVALRGSYGAVMAGDRRATMGNIIAQRDIEKVFPADEMSLVGIAGTAGIAVELVRLYQVELEHYEKIEGVALSTDGKANRLSALLRGNLGLALQGLAVVPILAGFDVERGSGRIFSYDVTGGRYEEVDFHSVGSGSLFARGSLKKLYDPGMSAEAAVRVALQALYDAADDDSATGGPDVTRRIFPVVGIVSEDGVRMLPEGEVAVIADEVVTQRMRRPDGPFASLSSVTDRQEPLSGAS